MSPSILRIRCPTEYFYLTGFRSSGPYDLTVIDQRGSERRVPKSEGQKIVSAEKIKDGLGNGAAVGAGVGLEVGLAA